MGLFDKFSELDNERKINKKLNDFFANDDYLKRLSLRYAHDKIDNDKIKVIIKSEIVDVDSYSINKRYMGLLKMDVDSLYELHLDGIDTSKFSSQDDLDDYFGEDYAQNYQKKFDELVRNYSSENYSNKFKPLSKNFMKKEKEEMVKFGPKIKRDSSEKTKKSFEKLENLLYEEESSNNETVVKKEVPLIKSADIEIFKKVKSNTALASTALFLATGVFVAEAKEEMKYVRTKLNIKDDGIEIKNPHSYHKFIDFRGFKVDKEDNYYLYYIVLSDEEMIHFRTKNKDLHEVILDKIKSTSGLTYERNI